MVEEYVDRYQKIFIKLLLILLILICIFIVFSIFSSQSVKAEEVSKDIDTDTTWYSAKSPYYVTRTVRVNKELTIEPGTEIIFNGSYHLMVYRSLIADGNETHNIVFRAPSGELSRSFWKGIDVVSGEIYLNYCGIYNAFSALRLQSTSNIVIENTDFSNCSTTILMVSSQDNRFTNITITDSNNGIEMISCSNCNLSSVRAYDIEHMGLEVEGGSRKHYDHNITDFEIDDKPLYYFFDLNNQTIENISSPQIILAWSENIVLNNCKVTDASGISLDFVKATIISNCTIDNNYYGIHFYKSNSKTGSDALENLIINNTISGNYFGVLMYYSDDNRFVENDFSFNDFCAIHAYESNGNMFYHNNFMNNTDHVMEINLNRCDNRWYNSGEGNYWDNYTGNDTDGDGIGDTPHNVSIYSESTDDYPLMSPWTGSLPPDTKPPIFINSPSLFKEDIIIPRDNLSIGLHISEPGHYEVIIDTDSSGTFDNSTDWVTCGPVTADFHNVVCNLQYENGIFVEEGEYLVQVMVWDKVGNRVEEPYCIESITIVWDKIGENHTHGSEENPQGTGEGEDVDPHEPGNDDNDPQSGEITKSAHDAGTEFENFYWILILEIIIAVILGLFFRIRGASKLEAYDKDG